jgi:RNA polymerase sigma-70 factor (ECF subfamily)
VDLAQQLRRPEADAHADLCDRFGAALHGFAAQRLGGDEELAEDVMVQTLVDVVRNIRRFDPARGTLASWVFGIARRKIQGERRKLLRAKSIPRSAQTSLDEMREVSSGEDLSVGVAARLHAERAAAAIAQVLSEAEMEVLILHCVDGFSVREIGRIVGRSAKAVDSLLHRAKRKAREELARADGSAG